MSKMDKEIKREIICMLIPLIGLWFVVKRIVPDLGKITWWDTNKAAIPTILSLAFYQAIFLILLKYICSIAPIINL